MGRFHRYVRTEWFEYRRSRTYTCEFVRLYKKFLLNSAVHEISKAHKYKTIKTVSNFQAQTSLECYFFLLTDVKLPTTVGILTFMSRKTFMLS